MTRPRFTLVLLAVLSPGCRSGGTAPTSTTATPAPAAAPERDAAAATMDAGSTASAPDASAPEAPASSDAGAPPRAGGWSELSPTDPEVLAAARAAVAERQRQQGGSIQLVSVAWAQGQVVSGMNYRLGLEVTVNRAPQQVTAVVWVQAWRNSRALTTWTQGFARP